MTTVITCDADVSDEQTTPPALAGIGFADGFDIDTVLAAAADQLTGRGFKVAGLVQEEERLRECCPDTYVRNLASGSRTKISQDRGEGARGCRLDWDALSAAAGEVERTLAAGADILIINRFGQSESEGRGLRQTIELAIERRLPVLVAVRQGYAAAWQQFHGGLADDLRANAGDLLSWSARALATGR